MRVELLQAAELLKDGKIVGIPTETVYGLATSVFDSGAVDSLYALKERPRTNPLITQVARIEDLQAFTENFPDGFEALAKTFWPGTLTIVLPINEESMPSPVRGGLATAAFRIPGHPLTLALLKETGPLAVPSANKSGSPPATCREDVENDFGKDFPVLDGGVCEGGIESTILTFKGNRWLVERVGAIVPEEFTQVLGYTPLAAHRKESERSIAGNSATMSVKLHLRSVSYDGSMPHVLGFSDRDYPQAEVTSMGMLSDPKGVSLRLYPALRELEEKGIKDVWVDMNFPTEGILATVASRLEKIAS